MPCKSLPTIDFSHWAERGSRCNINNKLIEAGKTEQISPCVSCVCTKEGVRTCTGVSVMWSLLTFIFFPSFSQPICNSMRVKNCLSLTNSFSRQEILQDSVCKVQCAFALRLVPAIDTPRQGRSSVFGFSSGSGWGASCYATANFNLIICQNHSHCANRAKLWGNVVQYNVHTIT